MSIAEAYLKGFKKACREHGGKACWKHFETLKSGATPENIAALKHICPDMPHALAELLSFADGTYHRVYRDETVNLYVLGSDEEEYPYYLLSAKQMKNAGLNDKAYEAYLDGTEVDERIADDPKVMHWLHFADCMNNGGTSQLFLDFSSGGKGTYGQVIGYYHDPDQLRVIADSFDEYLTMLMERHYDFIHEDDFIGHGEDCRALSASGGQTKKAWWNISFWR